MINIPSKRIFNRHIWALLLVWVSFTGVNCKKSASPVKEPPLIVSTFSNPIINGADPSVYQKDNTYYYLQTTGTSIRLWKTDGMTKLNASVPKTVYTPVAGSPNSRNIWAPEIYFLDGKWYIYYTAGNGDDASQRTWVLENSSADPTTGTWIDRGRIFSSGADFWAIDGSILEYNGNRYFLWCGRPDPSNLNLTQNIYLAKMVSALSLESVAVKLSDPEFVWEKNGFGVNEAPQILKSGTGRIYLTYSASYCGSDDYALGMLTLKNGGDPLLLADWTKSAQPVFTKKPQSNAYGPGHNSFFTSKDGSETWMIYHANSTSNQGCADQRNIRMQKISFSANGSPIFGEPVATGLQIKKPSGE